MTPERDRLRLVEHNRLAVCCYRMPDGRKILVAVTHAAIAETICAEIEHRGGRRLNLVDAPWAVVADCRAVAGYLAAPDVEDRALVDDVLERLARKAKEEPR